MSRPVGVCSRNGVLAWRSRVQTCSMVAVSVACETTFHFLVRFYAVRGEGTATLEPVSVCVAHRMIGSHSEARIVSPR